MKSPLAAIHRFTQLFPRHYYLIWVGTLVNRLGSFVLPFFSLYLVRAQNFTPVQVGQIVAAYGLGATLSGPLGGWLADRWGRRPTLISSLFLGAALLLVLMTAKTYLGIMLSMGLYGLFGEMYRPASNAAVVDIVPPLLRTAAFDALYWAVNLGFAIGTFTGGMVIEWSFAPIFWVNALSLFLFGVIITLFLPETRPSLPSFPAANETGPAREEAGLRRTRGLSYWLAPYRDGTFMWLMAATLLTTTLFFQTASTFPISLNQMNIFGKAYGQIIALNGILITTCQPLVAHLTKRRRPSTMIAVGFLLNALGFGTLTFATQYITFVIAEVVLTFGEICWVPRSNAALAFLAPPHLRGNYMGVNFIVWGAASVLAPLLGTALLQHYGRFVLWPVGAAGGIVATLIVWRLRHKLDARCQVAEEKK